MFKRIFSSLLAFALFPIFSMAQEGELFTFHLGSSKIYPGTQRDIAVYVPSGYDASADVCLIVRLDGIGSALPKAMDKLTGQGSMPMAIAIGIEPGKIKDSANNVIRYNRSNEFDRIDGKFASFLETEVIPALKSQKIPSNGLPIRISDKASDRAITGVSSGGIGAFCAAWNRPDMFSRIYCVIGTFVPFRYGDQLPGIIRKTEPKRLRIFLQDNESDTWNPIFGSWYEANRLMCSAFEFAGYEVDHQWNQGGHDGRYGDEAMERVMAWLWAGWPEEVRRGISNSSTLKAILDTSCTQWQKVSDGIRSGMVLQSIEGKSEPEVVPPGKKFDPMIAIYPGGGLKAQAREESCWILNSVKENGSFKYEQEYYCLHSPAKQICFDTMGYLYCATDMGVQICDHNGRVRAILPLPHGPVEAVTLVGSRLFVISAGSLWVRTINRKGFFNPNDVPAPHREGQG